MRRAVAVWHADYSAHPWPTVRSFWAIQRYSLLAIELFDLVQAFVRWSLCRLGGIHACQEAGFFVAPGLVDGEDVDIAIGLGIADYYFVQTLAERVGFMGEKQIRRNIPTFLFAPPAGRLHRAANHFVSRVVRVRRVISLSRTLRST